jgi:hypothetical protein
VKIELSNVLDFTVMGAYESFDFNQFGHMDLNEFTDNLFLYIGDYVVFDRKQAQLLFLRYSAPRISYTEFCRMVLPSDSCHQGKVLARPSRRMTFVAEENLKRVLRA